MLENAANVDVGYISRASYAHYVRDHNKFAVSWELVPGRGACEASQETVLATAKQLALSGKIRALTITDNPGGTSALSAAMLGVEIKKFGVEPLVHLTCKDKNRNELESLLYGLERAHVHNLLVMTGDYPKSGALGTPKPVFDLDPVTLMMLITRMNAGLEVPTLKGSTRLKPASFFAGVAASPFKQRESEQMGQYFKLNRKLKAGAHFVVSQIGFDARKFHELLQVVNLLSSPAVPVIGNIYVLPLPAARLMNANGLPGCVVSDKLLTEIEAESAAPDKGKGARLERAAKLYAILKGMGFAGTHISGNGLSCDNIESLIERGEELAPNWTDLVREFDYPQKDGWYYFERDERTGLNSTDPSQRAERTRPSFGYRAMSFVHRSMFEKSGKLFEPMQHMAKAVDGSPLEAMFARFEHVLKGLTSDCLQCGDCAMLDIAYLCPQSQCAKNQRNGPCGGSHDGFCEKFPNEKECIYVRAYERADFSNGEPIPPVNWELNRTSSWLNFFLGRDHSGPRLGMPKIDQKKGKR
jgi:methylenetetrahydrofolate reductase (NADPH)